MLKKIIQLVIFLSILIFPISSISAQEEIEPQGNSVNIYFFWGEGCPHCAKEKPFLEKMEEKYPEVEVYDYEVWSNKENLDLMIAFGNALNTDISGVPFTAIGEQSFIGWMDEEYTGKQIEEAINCVLDGNCEDIGEKISLLNKVSNEQVKGEQTVEQQEKVQEDENVVGIPEKMDLPLIGEIKTKDFSLPLLTVVLGVLDGFNPCAMWSLIFLISLLLGLKNRKRMWILGSTFIFTSAFVYFLFMAAWLNFILFIGMVTWVRILIGLVALGGGIYNLVDYFKNKDGHCKVTNTDKRQKVFQKLKDLTYKKSFWFAIGGIIILAFAVNLVEAVCSAGLPVVYTQILSLNGLSTTQYYLYILLYIFFFMLDDLIIFFVAMTTLKMTGLTNKYSKWSSIIGGLLMLLIGLILIFKPELLMFG